jgi:hypothetical protein
MTPHRASRAGPYVIFEVTCGRFRTDYGRPRNKGMLVMTVSNNRTVPLLSRFFFLVAMAAAGGAGTAAAAPICDLVFQACPDQFAGSVVTVPRNVLALDYRIPYCSKTVKVAGGGQPRPLSIVFIIDHSYSMVDLTDPDFERFTQTQAMIRQIQDVAPQAEVGLVVFRGDLRYDHRDNAYFKQAFPGDPFFKNDSYVPLTRLDKAFPNGRSGLDTLEAFLQVKYKTYIDTITTPDKPGWSQLDTVHEPYLVHETKLRDSAGTDISLGFDAAKIAMQPAAAAPEDRYFIFLSDGIAEVDRPNVNDFQAGRSVPTTFTIFFHEKYDSNQTVPPAIKTMTTNIRANGYSANNPKSAYWSINVPGDQLLKLLQTEVFGKILVLPTRPKDAVVSSPGGTWSTGTVAGGDFLFAGRIPLSGTDETFSLAFTYSYVDSSGGRQVTRDTLVRSSVTVRRGDVASPPSGMTTSCREQESLALYFAGAPVTAVRSDETSLETRLTSASGQSCQGCHVEVRTDRPVPPGDRETVTLLSPPGATVAAGTFARELRDPAVSGDGRLQHLAGDSIVLVYRNPDVPLDTVRRAYPFILVSPLDTVSPVDTTKPPIDTTKPPIDTLVSPVDTVQPKPVVLPVLNLGGLNDVARPDLAGGQLPQGDAGTAWLTAGAAAFAARPAGQCCGVLPAQPDTATRRSFVGVRIEASREFSVQARVFTNFGEFMGSLDVTLSPEQFAALPQGERQGTRVLKLWWNNRGPRGEAAATGAYILRVTARVGPQDGNPGREAKATRIFGLVR